ncbi:IS110 family transposase, partial [Devosia indica]|uniref:IS110 family transposase n=1 Tax=Devosia indica TaxID=2079253 RepID=UPI0018E58B8F
PRRPKHERKNPPLDRPRSAGNYRPTGSVLNDNPGSVPGDNQHHVRLQSIDRAIIALLRTDEVARRLSTIPGIGPVGATALAASVADPRQFRSGREFAAWLGLTPSQNSSGGKDRLGRITKMGDRYLRKLLVIGATSLVRRAKHKPEAADPYLLALLARKPARVASVAMANKMARVVWAVMARGEVYQARHAPSLAG